MPVIPRPENLIPQSQRTPEEAREMGRKGGIASGEARREKKRMSQIYADFLIAEHDIKLDDEMKKLTGSALLAEVMKRVLAQGGGPAVSMMKEIREATEGSKASIEHSGTISNKLTPEERKARIDALKSKLD